MPRAGIGSRGRHCAEAMGSARGVVGVRWGSASW